MSKAEGQTIKQLRGQISALARENKMLNHKMSLLEQNATLKQNAMFSSFLKWMEENGPKTNLDDDHHGKDGKHPTVEVPLKEEPMSTASPCRSNVDNGVPTVYDHKRSEMNKSSDMRASYLNSNPVNAQHDRCAENQTASDARMGTSMDESTPCRDESRHNLDDCSHKESSQHKPKHRGGVSLPNKSPFDPLPDYRIPSVEWKHPPYYDHYFEHDVPVESTTADRISGMSHYWPMSPDKNHDHAQLRSTPITSTPKKPSISSRNAEEYDDLEARVGSLLEETRLAASPGLRAFAADDVTRDIDSRPVTSTPAKTPQKKVMFADEMNSNTSLIHGDPASSVPRAYNCDPLNLTTPLKTQGSASRKLACHRDGSLPANDEGLVVSRDERSFRHPTLNDDSDSRNRQRGGKSKRPTLSRKGDTHNISKNYGARSKSSHENFSAKRDLSFNKISPRPSVNVKKLFGSRENESINHEHNSYDYQHDQSSLGGESKSKRSRYEGVTNASSGLTSVTSPRQSKFLSDHRSFNADSDISINDSTIESLENELRGIYKQNLDDEVKITEIRRNAVRRFDNWRDAMESEMVKLESDSRERLADNLNKLSQSLPPCLKCDCSTGFDGNSRSVDISEGRLSELEVGLGSRLTDLEDSREKKLDESVGAETSLKTEPPSQKHGMERKRSIDKQTTSPKSRFMVSPDTIIFGEIAFQLERVVLSRVFRGGSKQLTGYTLSNIEKMIRSHYDNNERPMLQRQLDEVKGELHICGWNHEFHPKLVAHLIKKFGTFPTNVRAKSAARKRGWTEPQALKEEVLWRIPKKYIHDMIIILDCLFYLSKKYDIPLFTW